MRKVLSILLVVLVFASSSFGQPPFPPPPSQAVPLDVIVGLLLVAGTVFGLRKLLKERKPASAES